MPGNHASRIAGDFAATSVSVERAAVEQHDDERLAGRGDPVDQLLLLAGQVERRARLGLAAHLAGLAEREHDLVGRLRRGDGLVEAGACGAVGGRVVVRRVDVRQSQAFVNVVFGSCALIPV